ncbi:MAG: holin [Caldilinea sp. CFX5]|nr:holin [Caldilinea sp. CFX5]
MTRLSLIKMGVGLLAGVWASLSLVLQVLLLLMILDFITGIAVAIQQGAVSSHRSYQGIGKKVIVLTLVTATAVIQQHLNVDLPIVEIVAGFYIANEFISILENAALAGVPVPGALRDMLAKLNDMAKR